MARVVVLLLALVAPGARAVNVATRSTFLASNHNSSDASSPASVELDFETLKNKVISSETFQERVKTACAKATFENCTSKMETQLFCKLLRRSKPLVADEHCGMEPTKKFLLDKSRESGIVNLPSGLMYRILRKGDGKFHPTDDSECTVNYRGALMDGTLFDSSYSRGEPSKFAPKQVIKGWTEALKLMSEGEKRELYVPPELGYGDQGAGSMIPGGAVLVFEMELLKIEGPKIQVG